MQRNRREFLENVGSGMLIAGLGSSLGVSSAFAAESLEFGKLRPLVGLLQETPAEKIQPILVKKLKDGGTDLKQLIAAAALANAETFGGEDYVGFHTETELFPLESHLEKIKTTDAGELLETAAGAIRKNDQGQAAAAIAVYGQQGHALRPVLDLMLRFGCSEDGRLHAEKYFHTVGEEYRTTSKTFRWRQIVGLARVTASSYGYNRKDEHGHRAPGYEQVCSLLGVDA